MYLKSRTYNKICWICSNIANSNEHKFKKSDITSIYGKGQYSKNYQPVHIRENKITPIRGAKAKILTFENVLCEECNNDRSQPWDKSYSVFSEYLRKNNSSILKEQKLNFKTIYGNDWKNKTINLFKYFIKIFGCYIATSNNEVSKSITDFLLDETKILKHIKFKFYLKPDIIYLQEYYKNNYFHIFYGKVKWIGKSKSEIKSLTGWFTNSGISIYWVYNLSIDTELKFKPYIFKQIENLPNLMVDLLPKNLNEIIELIEYIENYNSEKMELTNGILNE